MKKNYEMTLSTTTTMNGISRVCSAETLLGAKREATRLTSYGQNATVTTPEGNVWKKEFWQNGNRFGWKNWKLVY